MQFADYAAPEVCATPSFRLNQRARRSDTCPQATQPHASMCPQPKQPSKTMRTLITATHSHPVQYSQDHAYRQEAPTPAPPRSPSPRGRELVEPYRPLGPLPPRTVRAVARLGPHPVANGHLVDVAALAAPPCGLAAYGLRAGGLQAPVHARVPHRRYAGMRGGQVVVAGEHLASRAVRAARVRLALRARSAMRPDHSWPSLRFHQTRLLELAITSVGFRSPLRSLFHSLAILGCVVLRSL